MTYRIERANNASEALTYAEELLGQYKLQGILPVVLVPTLSAASRVRHALMDADLSMGVRVETPSSWIADRWELFGDGRLLVPPSKRTLLIYRAILETLNEAEGGADQIGFGATPGTIELIARLAREALPFFAGDLNRTAPAELSSGERAVVRSLNRYAELLAAEGSCEESQAAVALVEVLDAVPPLVVLGFDEISYAHDWLLGGLAGKTEVVRIDDSCAAPACGEGRGEELQGLLNRLFKPLESSALEPVGAVHFLLPAGKYAAPSLVADEILGAVRSERVASLREERACLPVFVMSPQPALMFSTLADYLAQEGAVAALAARTKFAQTAFGRAFLALVRFACDESYLVCDASDFALSMFSGLSRRDAGVLDARWRGDRTIDRASIAADLSQKSDLAAHVLAELSQGHLSGALTCFEQRIKQWSDVDGGFRAAQLSAVGAAQRFCLAADEVGMSGVEVIALLKDISLPISLKTASSNAIYGDSTAFSACDVELELQDDLLQKPREAQPAVVFMTLFDGAEKPACSCSTLILCDLAASAYPVRAEENGATLLMQKAGLAQPADALMVARRCFFRALSTARDRVVCERPLHTVDADEAYPAIMYEELIDCYREDPTRSDDLDRDTGLPFALAPYARTAGEDALHGNLALGQDPSAFSSLETCGMGEVSAEGRMWVVLPREGVQQGRETALVALSPSAIESYLECPGKWFALRRLRLSEPDAGFGLLEMGSFSHGVLKSFYEHFGEAGHTRINAENIDAAQKLLREVFARHAAFQPELKRNRNPLVPRTAFEQAEMHDLECKLVGFLEREVTLLPGFTPKHFEFDFGSTEPFIYAGCALRGSIDRIDVNERGQAVVIDYKGSLTSDYALASATPAERAGGMVLPHKVQALVYAQVAQRLLGYEVVGALYVSYGRKAQVSGAVDRTVLDEKSIPGIKIEDCGVPGVATEALQATSFAEVVGYVEDGIARAAQSMTEGFIAPEPRGKDPCGYCPVLACEKRKSL